MKLRWIVVLVLASLVALIACNKQKPKSLDYTEEFQTGTYDPQGMPGEGHVGSSPADVKASGYDPNSPQARPEEKQPETCPAPQPVEPPKPADSPAPSDQPKNP